MTPETRDTEFLGYWKVLDRRAAVACCTLIEEGYSAVQIVAMVLRIASQVLYEQAKKAGYDVSTKKQDAYLRHVHETAVEGGEVLLESALNGVSSAQIAIMTALMSTWEERKGGGHGA